MYRATSVWSVVLCLLGAGASLRPGTPGSFPAAHPARSRASVAPANTIAPFMVCPSKYARAVGLIHVYEFIETLIIDGKGAIWEMGHNVGKSRSPYYPGSSLRLPGSFFIILPGLCLAQCRATGAVGKPARHARPAEEKCR